MVAWVQGNLGGLLNAAAVRHTRTPLPSSAQQLLTDSAGVKCQTAEEGDTTDWKARALAAEQQCQATQRELTGLEEATTTRPFNPASVSCLMQRSFAQEVTDTLLSWPLTCRADGWQ